MAKEIFTMSDVWLKIAQFLGTLNGENVKRESYVRTPEYEAALEAWKKTEQEWEAFLESLPARAAWESPWAVRSCFTFGPMMFLDVPFQ